MRIRPATPDDLTGVAHVFDRSSAWLHQRYRADHPEAVTAPTTDRRDFHRHLLETGAMFIAEDPNPIGFSAAVLRERVWFLSQLWVLPERHGAGVGSALLEAALAWGRGADALSVVASPSPVAQALYLRATMLPLWTQLDLAGAAGALRERGGVRVTPLVADDHAWIDDLDREVRGVARREDHGFWGRAATGVAIRRAAGPAGYVYGWPDGKIGPGAARDLADVPDLLAAAAGVISPTTRVSVAVPSSNRAALETLARAGFSTAGSNTFMASRRLGDASRYISSGGGLA